MWFFWISNQNLADYMLKKREKALNSLDKFHSFGIIKPIDVKRLYDVILYVNDWKERHDFRWEQKVLLF